MSARAGGQLLQDSYVDESKRFRLSHAEPHGHPLEAYNLQDGDYLTRMEVVVARDVFKHLAYNIDNIGIEDGGDFRFQMLSAFPCRLKQCNEQCPSPRFCRSVGDFELSHSDAEKVIGKPIPVNMWCSRMSRALEEACGLEGSRVSRLGSASKQQGPWYPWLSQRGFGTSGVDRSCFGRNLKHFKKFQ